MTIFDLLLILACWLVSEPLTTWLERTFARKAGSK